VQVATPGIHMAAGLLPRSPGPVVRLSGQGARLARLVRTGLAADLPVFGPRAGPEELQRIVGVAVGNPPATVAHIGPERAQQVDLLG